MAEAVNRVIGNEKNVEFLDKSIRDDRLVHAYLFTGPESVGKTRVALEFARKLFGKKYDFKFGESEEKQISRLENHADFICLHREMDEKKGKLKKEISVDQVRAMIEKISLTSFLNSYKVALIPEARALNKSSANSLLKTLEEPKGKTIIILCAPSADEVLPTIVSRCQVINFELVGKKKILNALIENGVEESDAKKYSAISYGRPGLAIKFLQNQGLFEEYQNSVQEASEFLKTDIASRLVKMENYLKDIEGPEKLEKINEILHIWSSLLRDAFYIKNSEGEEIVNFFLKDSLEDFSKRISTREILKIFNELARSKEYLRANVNPRLILENLILTF